MNNKHLSTEQVETLALINNQIIDCQMAISLFEAELVGLKGDIEKHKFNLNQALRYASLIRRLNKAICEKSDFFDVVYKDDLYNVSLLFQISLEQKMKDYEDTIAKSFKIIRHDVDENIPDRFVTKAIEDQSKAAEILKKIKKNQDQFIDIDDLGEDE